MFELSQGQININIISWRLAGVYRLSSESYILGWRGLKCKLHDKYAMCGFRVILELEKDIFEQLTLKGYFFSFKELFLASNTSEHCKSVM